MDLSWSRFRHQPGLTDMCFSPYFPQIVAGGQGNTSHVVFKNYAKKHICLDVPKAEFTEGQPLIIYHCDQSRRSQRFELSPFGDNPAWMYIKPRAAPWLCLDLGNNQGSPLKLATCSASWSQRFALSTANWFGGDETTGNG